MQHKYINHLFIEDSAGNRTEVSGKLEFVAGANMALASDSSGITISAGSGLKTPSSEMLQKWNAVLGGGSGTALGEPYSFSGVPYYISSINGTQGLDGDFFIVVDKCYHFGTFDPSADTAILDTCPACLDCPDFDTINTLLNILQAAIDLQKGRVEDNEGLLDKYMSMTEHWNYVVLLKSWRYNAEARGNEIYASCKYTNHTDLAIPSGIVMYIDFQNVPTNSKTFFIDTAVKDFNRNYYTIARTSDTRVTLTTTQPLPKGAGIRFYCGNLSPDYTGNTVDGSAIRVQVNFSLTFPSGGIGNKASGFNTNQMVVIDPRNDDIWDREASSSSEGPAEASASSYSSPSSKSSQSSSMSSSSKSSKSSQSSSLSSKSSKSSQSSPSSDQSSSSSSKSSPSSKSSNSSSSNSSSSVI